MSDRTFERYAEIVQKHLVPALGKIRLEKLTPAHIQAYYTRALSTGRRDGRGGLSAQTVLHHHRVLREALQYAVLQDRIARNPADRVKPPKVSGRQLTALDANQLTGLLEAAKGSRLYIPILLAATAGQRRGEITALRWRDVNLTAGTLAVRRALEKTRAGGLKFKDTKTERARVVSLLPLTVDALRDHRLEQTQQRSLAGIPLRNENLVCAEPDGSPMDPDAVTKGFQYLCRRLPDLPRIRFHDLRHTYASLLLHLGVPVKDVSELLGHSTATLTLNTYGHVLPGARQDAARRLQAAIEEAAPSGEDLEPDQPLPN